MLVLSRKRNETIRIGEHGEITIVLVEIRGDKARIGVEADRSVPVHRGEVFAAILRQKENGPQFVPLKHEQSKAGK